MKNATLDEVHWGQNITIEGAKYIKKQMTSIVTWSILVSNVDFTLNDKDRTKTFMGVWGCSHQHAA